VVRYELTPIFDRDWQYESNLEEHLYVDVAEGLTQLTVPNLGIRVTRREEPWPSWHLAKRIDASRVLHTEANPNRLQQKTYR
jgi:hypothetical protein